MPTTPPTITPTPTPAIQRGDRTTFSSRVDAFIQWLVTAVTQFNGAASATNTNAAEAVTAASAASSSAAAASASASGAAVASGVSVWVSGTTYQVGDTRYSPFDFRTYRRKTNGAGATDPFNDSTNWQLISAGAFPLIHVRGEKPSGTPGGAHTFRSSFNQVRELNAVKTNTAGATVSANVITLPPGVYRATVRAMAPGDHKVALHNDTDGTFVLIGDTPNSDTNSSYNTVSEASGQFTISAQKNFTLRDYLTRIATDSRDLGAPLATGQVEVYAEVYAERVS